MGRRISTLVSVVRTALIVGLAAASLSACSKQQAAAPALVSAEDRQRAAIDPAVNNSSYSSIADKLSSMPQDVYDGSDVAFGGSILNTGGDSKGLRFLLKGSALSQGLLEGPKQAMVVIAPAADKEKSAEVQLPLSFEPTSGEALEAKLPDTPYSKQFGVSATFHAKQGGTGTLELYAYPLDHKGTSSAVITKNYRVLSENDNSEQPEQ